MSTSTARDDAAYHRGTMREVPSTFCPQITYSESTPSHAEQEDLSRTIQWSLDRVRRQCIHATEYTHDGVRVWLVESLPGWRVHVPPVLGKDALYEAWPAGSQLRGVKKWLVELGCRDPEDLVNGACEPLALYLSQVVEELVDAGGVDGALLLESAHRRAVTSLRVMGPKRATATVFGNGFAAGSGSWTPGVWGGHFSDSAIGDLLYGTEACRDHIRALVHRILEDRVRVARMPFYILNYIWDQDELTREEMAETDSETAQYSCHVAGLVLDVSNRTLYVADANGGLIAGGSMRSHDTTPHLPSHPTACVHAPQGETLSSSRCP